MRDQLKKTEFELERKKQDYNGLSTEFEVRIKKLALELEHMERQHQSHIQEN